MNRTYPISPRVAEQASRDYLAIVRAGLLPELRRELELSVEAHYGTVPTMHSPGYEHHAWESRRLDQWRDGRGWALRSANEHADELAKLLDCRRLDVEPYVVPELLDGPTRRSIVLDCLRDMAGRARQRAGRRSA